MSQRQELKERDLEVSLDFLDHCVSLVVLYLVLNCDFVFIANNILFIGDLVFFSFKSYVPWSIIEVIELLGFGGNENNRCYITCPGSQPLEFKCGSLTCIEMWDLN